MLFFLTNFSVDGKITAEIPIIISYYIMFAAAMEVEYSRDTKLQNEYG